MPGNELTYYDLLGLKPDSSQDEIRTAYDALMVRMRPNVEYDSASTIRLAAAVKEAWETLGDPDKRRAYDETLKGTAAYGEIWQRSQQASYLEERNKWFDQQVRRAQKERQATHELEADRQQYFRDVEGIEASRRALEAARESQARAAAANESVRKRQRSRAGRAALAAAAIAAALAALVWFIWFRPQSPGTASSRQTNAAPAAVAASASAPHARVRPSSRFAIVVPKPGSSPALTASQLGPAGQTVSSATSAPSTAGSQMRTATGSAGNPPSDATHAGSSAAAVRTLQSHHAAAPRLSFRCTTVMIASVTHDGAVVDLSDGSRFSLSDPVDRAEAGGWSTGSPVAKCGWPASMNRPATLDVNGYTAHALPAVVVAAATPAASPSGAAAASCADVTITEVADDGFAIGLSDGHSYAVDDAGHVSVAAWLVGEPVTVCSLPLVGPKAFTVARYGNVVHALRTQTRSVAASAPTLCVVRLVSSLAGDGSNVVFSDGHTYRVDSSPSRAIVAGWTQGERITVCIKSANGIVYATLAHGSLTAHAVRAD